MDLPIRIVEQRVPERLVSVDGAWGQSGLNLSHWPGNTTPRELKHDLSTGIALNFARLSEARRAELSAGCVGIANNHVDTDGVCALFAVRHPAAALEREAALLAAAWAGDFFRVPDERAFQVDAVITGCFDAERSPWRERLRGLDDRARREAATIELVERLPALLDGDLAEHADLWRPALEDLRADRADLALAQRDEIVHLDAAVFTAPTEAKASRARGSVPHFDPGRHAVFGTTEADRVLLVGPRGAGATYRLLVNTTSWFELPGGPRLARPSLEDLAARLNALESCTADDDLAWRTHPTASAAPELWFGLRDAAFFGEHAPWLGVSRLAPSVVRAGVLDALRGAWTFPDDG